MGSRLDDGFAVYPMVEEAEATGVVAGVYAGLLERMPFVPSLFKSLAVSPGYLVLASEQGAGVMEGEAFRGLAGGLAESVRDAASPPDDAEVRAGLAAFVGPLGRMLLLSAGLLLALDGELDAPPAPGRAPEPRPVRPDRPAPSAWDAPAPELYGQIRAALETPLVNSIWRSLAGSGRLAAACATLLPQAERTRPRADDLQRRALEAARRVPWEVAATPQALERDGLLDTRPALAAVLDAYVKTLPRVLTLVAATATGDDPAE